MKQRDTAPIGMMPTADALDLTGLSLPEGTMEQLLSVDRDEWSQEADGHKKFFDTFDGRVPAELQKQQAALKERLKEMVTAA